MKRPLIIATTSALSLSVAHSYATPRSPSVSEVKIPSANPAAKKVSYDLGIGKNLPVASEPYLIRSSPHSSWGLGPQQHAAFLIEHQTVHEHPHPPQMAAANNPKPKTAVKPIVPSRLADDILEISHAQGDKIPTMVPVDGQASSFNVNTPWVEMLIHEQQQKFGIA